MGNDFADIVLDTLNKAIWAITTNGGLNKIDLLKCAVTEKIESINLFKTNDQWCRKIFIKDSFLFILSNTDVIAKYNCSAQRVSRLIDLPLSLGLSAKVDNLFLGADKSNILFLRNGSIIFTDSDFKERHTTIFPPGAFDSDSSETYYFTLSLVTDHLLIASRRGMLALNIKNRTFASSSILNCLPETVLRSRTRTFCYNYPVLLIANDLGLIKADIDKNEYEYLSPSRNKEGLAWIKNIFTIHFKNSSYWFGSQSGFIIIPNIESPVTGFSESLLGPPLKMNHCYNLLCENDSTLLSCASDGVYKVNLKNGYIKQIDNRQPYYQAFYFKGQIYFSGTTGLFHLIDNKLINVAKTSILSKAIQNDFIIAAANYGDTLLFLAGYKGREIYEIDIKNSVIKTINRKSSPINIKNVAINNFYIDNLGRLLIICDEGISIYDIKKQQIAHFNLTDPENNSVIELIMDGCETNERYYFAVYGKGIVETDKNLKVTNIISEKEGISNQGIYKLYNVGDSLLITGSNNGLFFYNIRTRRVSALTKDQGLHSNSFDETSGVRRNNFIFLGGNEGFTKIDVSKIKINSLAPELYFSSVEIKTAAETIDTSNLTMKAIRIPNNILQANIYFSTINYLNSEKTTISYKIKERHSNWINIRTNNFLTLLGFSPGTYHLQVKAVNEDGIESEIKELTLIFLPKWYQTLGFKILVIIIIAAIIYGLFRIRINHLKKEEKIRNQVASDLHDELGSTLNSVKVFTNLAMMEKNNSSHLEKIKEAAQSAIAGVKDIIWVLDDKRDTLDHLLTRISQFAKPICEAAGISYNQQSGGNENYKLGKEEKRNLYMIIKESINNSIKYSECSVIELLIKNKGGKLNITVSDNGKGFDNTAITTGYGLKNILRRSEEIGYRVEINSSAGNGTLIYLEKK